ncbi:LysR family transcriptional regulator [Streptomyces sp. NPDC059786]|uniref:LysR family transcriptional regulator n=1 Tax=Streptomyces sp. NPDC059786 TaxID=3346946 RepID=UPI00364D90E8
MGGMEIRQLRYFLAVAEERNFTRAAERLSMTQPALSRAIRELEKDVGSPLFLRTHRDVALTPVGEVMFEEAKALVTQVGHATSRVRRAAEELALLTATGPGCDAALLDDLVRAYNATGPARPARAAVGTADDQLDRLRSGTADVALWRAPVTGGVLDGVPLRRERLVVMVADRHPLAGEESVTVADLADEPVVRWTGANPQAMSPHLWPSGPPGRPGPEVSDGLQMLAVVRLGQAVSIGAVPGFGTPAPEGIARVPLADGPTAELRLVWLRERATPAVRRFARHSAAFLADRPGPVTG